MPSGEPEAPVFVGFFGDCKLTQEEEMQEGEGAQSVININVGSCWWKQFEYSTTAHITPRNWLFTLFRLITVPKLSNQNYEAQAKALEAYTLCRTPVPDDLRSVNELLSKILIS